MIPSSRLLPVLFLTALLIAGCDSATTPASGTGGGGSGAKTLPDAYAGLFTYGFGAAVGDTSFNDARIKGIATANFTSFSPENAGKWGSLQPNSDSSYSWGNLESLLQAADAQGIKIRLHAPVWHNQTPNWLFYTSGTGGSAATEALLRSRIDTFFTTVLNHVVPNTGGKKVADLVWAWDVVNEAVSDTSDGTGKNSYRSAAQSGWASCWTTLDPSGVPGYIVYAFTKARAVTAAAGHPEIKLVYNDYSVENPSKFATIKLILTTLKAKGLVDALGNQAHWSLANFFPSSSSSPSEFSTASGSTFANLSTVVTQVEDLGLKLQLTELDLGTYASWSAGFTVTNPTLASYQASLLPLQAEAYRQIFALLRTHADKAGGCVEHVTFWGVTDDSTWLDFNSSYTAKDKTTRPLLWYKSTENGGGVKQPIWDALMNFR